MRTLVHRPIIQQLNLRSSLWLFRLISSRHVNDDAIDDYKIIMLNKRYLSFRVIKVGYYLYTKRYDMSRFLVEILLNIIHSPLQHALQLFSSYCIQVQLCSQVQNNGI